MSKTFSYDVVSEFDHFGLIEHKVLDNWIQVDLSKNPNQLSAFIQSFPIPSEVIK